MSYGDPVDGQGFCTKHQGYYSTGQGCWQCESEEKQKPMTDTQCPKCLANFPSGRTHTCDPMMKGLVRMKEQKPINGFDERVGKARAEAPLPAIRFGIHMLEIILRPLFDDLTDRLKTLEHESAERVVMLQDTIIEKDKRIRKLEGEG